MGRLTVRLPSTLHRQLTMLASNEGVSLNQYIVYALTRQSSRAYTVQQIPEAEVERQRASFEQLLGTLGEASEEEIKRVLSKREVVEPESELEKEAIARLKSQMKERQLAV